MPANTPPQSPAGTADIVVARRAGVTLSIAADEVFASALATARLQKQLFEVLSCRSPLTVRLAGLGEAKAALRLLGRALAEISAAVSEAQAAPGAIEVAVSADSVLPANAWRERRRFLGPGSLYMLTDDRLLRPCHRRLASRRYDAFWKQLWQLRNDGHVRGVYAPHVRSQCPLLTAEPADSVLPTLGIQAPTGSAWITMRLNLLHFAATNGAIQEQALRRALQRCVDHGDALHEQARWATACMRHDAWLNRRLAIEITGIGDLVQRQGRDPRQFACLRDVAELMTWLQSVLRERSRANARVRGSVPALVNFDPCQSMSGDRHREGFLSRWSAALDAHATRHRNLLVLSPWAVFPADQPADPAFLNLLPLLRFADACSFSRPPRMRSWKINEFIILHQRTWAVLEQQSARYLFAEQV